MTSSNRESRDSEAAAAPASPSEALTRSLPSDTGGQANRPTIGPYRLLERVGQGGMGEVWLAEQVEPIRRRVALKLIREGLDSSGVIARFEAERQALAWMDHPNVARVFDAGATPEGRPYFVMEYVRGLPITEYCDEHQLTTAQRVRLFVKVCEGVQHAHQKGIIHRDLKPSNILVTEVDGVAVPKIIDFGLAKATHVRLTAQTLYTESGALVGTPEYMSPEQADMRGSDIDTRSDVYSLGVLLYELLVGTLPLEGRELRRAGYSEMCRLIREAEPPRPSTRVSTSSRESESAARNRRADTRALRRAVAGDLDWITMKALEKDRGRRYASASEFAADAERFLREEPVLAGPPSAAYRVSKFAHRHRRALLVATVAVAGLAALLIGLVNATAARRQATALRERLARSAAIAEYLRSPEATTRGSASLDRVLSPLGADLARNRVQPAEVRDVLTSIVLLRVRGRELQEAAHIGVGFEARTRFPLLVPNSSILVTPHLRVDGRPVSCDPILLGLTGDGTGGCSAALSSLADAPGGHTLSGFAELQIVSTPTKQAYTFAGTGDVFAPLSEVVRLPIEPLEYTVTERLPDHYPLPLHDDRIRDLLQNAVGTPPVRVSQADTGSTITFELVVWENQLAGPLALEVEISPERGGAWSPVLGLVVDPAGSVETVLLSHPIRSEGTNPERCFVTLPATTLGASERARVRLRPSRELALSRSGLGAYFDAGLERLVPIVRGAPE